MKKVCFLITCFFFGIYYSQKEEFSNYYKIKKNYENYPENDVRAFKYLNNYIYLAKKENNNKQLAQGYEDAVFYSSSEKQKLIYADSTIMASLLTKNNDLISDAYLGKGVIYYFNYKKYKPALEEYLKAYQYSKDSKDDYLKNEILYHLGVVKSHLGYYDSALAHFQKANSFFFKKIQEKAHPNIIFNNKKGYYNTLHRIIVCQRNLKRHNSVDSLIITGLLRTKNDRDFSQEYGYFLKEKGISEFRKKDYQSAMASLKKSLPPIVKINDFAWATVDYFYIGKSYLAINKPQKALLYFQKVDSVFNKHNFILPELRENYELLIYHYKNEKNNSKELYYTKQLLRADQLISKDFAYLSSTIHKEYDTKTLFDEKEKLEKVTSWGIQIIAGLIILAISLVTCIIIRFKNEQKIKLNYKILEEKIINYSYLPSTRSITKIKDEDKSALNETMVNNILKKLQSFEEKHGFIEYGLTINKLANKLNTNSTYLSQIINEYKGVNFNRYLGELRINYITNKLYNDKVFLNYKIETLAEKCGIASRTNFSNLFMEINGIRPTDFIKKRQQDMKINCRNFPKFNKIQLMSNQTSSSRLNLSKED
ncbi:YesN/AraC family two-component response regulator [Epilithonimonas hungarica]|uniref:AraC family transcriptional regulator n=1 Tax=Epilithonimonas hungarica TaxID=454006 RepID=UPI002786FA84|nr:AraC family transcriptional regulator [Epilithonimonas hungarica]MDP9955314.1 YesN/AraC family two-component response regulator [Epilithonimonas hungarica]